jgi:hypothetical protein
VGSRGARRVAPHTNSPWAVDAQMHLLTLKKKKKPICEAGTICGNCLRHPCDIYKVESDGVLNGSHRNSADERRRESNSRFRGSALIVPSLIGSAPEG